MRIWKFLGSSRLAFWLLISGAGCLAAGAWYTNSFYSFYTTLSTTPVHIWLGSRLKEQFFMVWWMVLLFGVMGCLGGNILVCAVQRIVQIYGQRSGIRTPVLIKTLLPSMIHLLFLVVLAGHLATFTMGQWEKVPIFPGQTMAAAGMAHSLEVMSVSHTYYPEDSGLKGRIAQTTVVVKTPDGRAYVLTHGHPVKIGGQHIYLDMARKKPAAAPTAPAPVISNLDEETCNKEQVYHTKKPAKENRRLSLLVVTDPGLVPISLGLAGILVLMVWYFIFRSFKPGI